MSRREGGGEPACLCQLGVLRKTQSGASGCRDRRTFSGLKGLRL